MKLEESDYKEVDNHVKFNGPDCTKCKNFACTAVSYPSGKCKKYGFSCGLGYKCKGFEERQ